MSLKSLAESDYVEFVAQVGDAEEEEEEEELLWIAAG
jgi:hypothetical protein